MQGSRALAQRAPLRRVCRTWPFIGDLSGNETFDEHSQSAVNQSHRSESFISNITTLKLFRSAFRTMDQIFVYQRHTFDEAAM